VSAHAFESQHKIIEWTVGVFLLVVVVALAVTDEGRIRVPARSALLGSPP
jgi:hypothetical protein